MHVYYAVSGNIAKHGALNDLCLWSKQRIDCGKAKIIKILKARPNETHARIVYEITADGIQATSCGRVIALNALTEAVCFF